MVMDTANGIMKKFLAVWAHAPALVSTHNGLNGPHALSVVLYLVLMTSTTNIVPITSSPEIQVNAYQLKLKTNVAILILLNVRECAKFLHGVTGVNAVLLMAGVSADENVLFWSILLVMKFVLNYTRLIDVTTSLLQTTALGAHGVTGVLALPRARLPLTFLHNTENATW
jgi:hypothetical protein